jgi:hypothetical protein
VETLIPTGEAYIPTGEAFIFTLPDEILLTIVEVATSRDNTDSSFWRCDCVNRVDYKAAERLARTCHRLNRLATPILYRTIDLGSVNILRPNKAVKSLHRTLHQNPSLSQYCRAISIHASDITDARDFSIVFDFVSWLTQVRCFEIHGGFDPRYTKTHTTQTWDLIRKMVQCMREIEHLAISREAWGLVLGPILKHVDLPRLKNLRIHGISHQEENVVLEPKVLLTFH